MVQGELVTEKSSDSRRNTSDHSSEKLLLALSQASDSLEEAMAARRAVDTRIFELTALSLTLIALLITIKPWSSSCWFGGWFYIFAFVAYGIAAVLGFWKYKATKSYVPDARAIFESVDSSYPNLIKWTTEDLLDIADEQYGIVHQKALVHSKMWYAFLVATAFLIFGALLY